LPREKEGKNKLADVAAADVGEMRLRKRKKKLLKYGLVRASRTR
jgi:hypothetical protein